MALSQGLQGLMESKDSFTQLGAVIKNTTLFQSAYNFVVYGTVTATAAQTAATNVQTGATVGATTATKLLRLAMLALPILLIVAGLAAVANAMGVFGDKTEDAEAKQKRLDKQLEKTNKNIEQQKKATDELVNIIDKQTRIDLINAKNRGASEAELTRIQEKGAKRRIEILEDEAKQAEKLYLRLSKSGSSKQFEAAEQSYLEIAKQLSDARLSLEESQAERVYQAKIKAAEKTKESLINISDEEMKLRESQRQMDEENLKEYLSVTQEGADAFKDIKRSSALETIQLLTDSKTKELEINKEANEKQIAQDKEAAEKKKQLDADVMSAKFKIATDTLSLISNVTELFGRNDEKRARQAFKIDKAAKISSAIISGIEGTINAYKTAQSSPITAVFPPYPAIQAGLAGAFAATNIAKISSTQFGASNGSNVTTSGSGGSSFTPSFNVVGNSGINQLANLQQQPVKAYITTGEVSTALSLERNTLQKTTF
jgi:hypothetical protein